MHDYALGVDEAVAHGSRGEAGATEESARRRLEAELVVWLLVKCFGVVVAGQRGCSCWWRAG